MEKRISMSKRSETDAPGGPTFDVREAQSAAEKMLDAAIKSLANAAADGKGKFFPNGIELIDVTVGVKQFVEVKFKIAGPKPPTREAQDEVKGEMENAGVSVPRKPRPAL